MNLYEERYMEPGYYWGKKPSESCYRVLKMLPPDHPLSLLDIGCGEGRNAVFFARNGYSVSAFDSSPKGIEKTRKYALDAGVPLQAFVSDINVFRLTEPYDVLFSTGVLQYIPPVRREELFENYRRFTKNNGLNALSVLVEKPFIPDAPDVEDTAFQWTSGELFSYYRDWKIEYCGEAIFDCMSGGKPHQHAVNRIVARKPSL